MSLLNKIHDELPVHEQIRMGLESEALRTNPAFVEAMKKLHAHYVQLEDAVTMGNEADAGKHRYHYSLMRTLITDLANQIDTLVHDGKNAQADLDLYGSEE